MACTVSIIRMNLTRMQSPMWRNSQRLFSTRGPHFAASVATEQSQDVTLEYLTGDTTGTCVLGFNSPRNKNAISRSFVQQVGEYLQKLRFDKDVRVLILRSLVPGVFCAGADLKERATMHISEVAPFVSSARHLVNAFYHMPMPTLAALDGAALGGGLEIALACDMRIASTSAKMGLVETRLAIIPGAGGTQRLPRLIGPAKAKELIFTARVIDGEEAAELGLVNYSVKQIDQGDAAYKKALDIAREIVSNGPVGVRMAKAAINRGLEVGLDAGLAFEEACYAQVIPTKDRLEGIAAFKEKRPPKFMGE